MAGTIIREDASQIITYAPGSPLSDPRWIGTIGHVSGLQYGYICPGGCDSMSATLEVYANYRTQAMDPGRVMQIIRGGGCVWEGIQQEAQPSASGWTLSAQGAGHYGDNYVAMYTDTWPTSQPDESINQAITRGMRWTNPGVGTPSGIWLGQEVDPAMQYISDLLNLVTSLGGLTWYVTTTEQGNVLSVFPLPTTPNRLLVSTTPNPRTVGGNLNAIYARWESVADGGGTGGTQPAQYSTNVVQNAADAAIHGDLESYIDLTGAGIETSGSINAVLNGVLKRYQRVAWTNTYTVQPGQLLNMGGVPVDLGSDQAGTVCQLMLTDYAFGGEVSLAQPISFLVGQYVFDDETQTAQITPFQYLNSDFSSLLQAAATRLTPDDLVTG